jgi:hypothetical protein
MDADAIPAVLILSAFVFLFLLIFSPTRAMLAWLFGKDGPIAFVLEKIWGSMGAIYSAHVVILRNLLPRSVVQPTLDKRTTKR